MKDVLAGDGAGGLSKKYFTELSIKEARQHLGFYIFNGLTLSTCIEYKFIPNREDVFHGNNFVYNSFGPRSAHRHKEFKALLA